MLFAGQSDNAVSEIVESETVALVRVELTDEQQSAINFVVDQLETGAKLVALSGPAGSGKTTLIKELIKVVETRLSERVVVAAMTNKAAFVLRTKGIPDALTLHQACMKPKFKPPMDRLGGFFDQIDLVDFEWASYPLTLINEFGKEKLEAALTAAYKSGIYSGFRALGIKDIFKYIESWEPKDAVSGVLFVDESSMCDAVNLETISHVFDQIVLVGDENQLPPVKGDPVFWQVENRVKLEHIHRQAEGSQPLRIATALRNGESVTPDPMEHIDVELSRKGYPVIVWRNKTRENLTRWIREKLGYTKFPDGSGGPLQPQIGEVLICRNAQDKGAKARGLINNSLWTVTAASGNRLDLINDQGEKVKGVHVMMEELDDGHGIPFRFAYALTAHSAQGSQWAEVMIHQPDAAGYCAMNQQEARKFLYTAVTRAAERVHWVTGMILDSNPNEQNQQVVYHER